MVNVLLKIISLRKIGRFLIDQCPKEYTAWKI